MVKASRNRSAVVYRPAELPATSTNPNLACEDSATHGHLFNDDLLMNDRDLQYARSQFPQMIHVLDNPPLRAKFLIYDKEANRARDVVRGLGLAAVAAATLSLVALATTPLWPPSYWTRLVVIVLELGGMIGAAVAGGGLWLGPWKLRWLESRLMSERLRQWHFQLMLRRLPQINASCKGPDDKVAFQRKRDQWFGAFLKAHEGKLDGKLTEITSELSDTAAWMHDSEHVGKVDADVLNGLFDCYQQLRFAHQYGYAVHKLQKSTDRPIWQFLKWPVICQLSVISTLISVCFVGALICSLVLIFGHVFGIVENVELDVRTCAIVVALIGVALKTLQDGLAPAQEIERFSDYRAKLLLLRDRFENTTDVKEKLFLMGELELASVHEMRGFLRTHLNSRFILM